eukprot:1611522-Pyramimonas_sp.AAC.1
MKVSSGNPAEQQLEEGGAEHQGNVEQHGNDGLAVAVAAVGRRSVVAQRSSSRPGAARAPDVRGRQ